MKVRATFSRRSRAQSDFRAAVSALNDVLQQAAHDAAEEFLDRTDRQLALGRHRIEQGVAVEQTGPLAYAVVASGEPVALSEYPHRANPAGGVDVQVHPGRTVMLRTARISRTGNIVKFSATRARVLFGPGIDQVARTEFPEIAAQAETEAARRLRSELERS